MQNQEDIRRYTAEELDAMLRRGESQTDWAHVDALTEEELEASIDHDEEGEFDWSTVQVGIPVPSSSSPSGSMPTWSSGSRPRGPAIRRG